MSRIITAHASRTETLERLRASKDAALRLLDHLRGVLRKCEWHESNGGETCPCCGGERPIDEGCAGAEDNDKRGHRPNCDLAAHLRGPSDA